MQVDIPTQTGAIGILPNHVPTFGALKPGIMTVLAKGSTEKYFVRYFYLTHYQIKIILRVL
jgi:F0F1-type ATP synthase epsilon subunit